ncbi:hypothetical protein ACWEPM_03265 [Streptomyces sp. NPDC004244]|uniref:hypothetical protein n=1 Tax=Streptomyces sp. NPDC101206 TaxID=3366128 RepID=UPI003827E905
MGFDEEWARLRAAAAAQRTAAPSEPAQPRQDNPPPAEAFEAAGPHPAAVAAEAAAADSENAAAYAREGVLERLADFRSRVLLVPLDERGGLWTSPFGGIDWICAFTGEEHLARFAEARGETDREWPYRRLVGARILDEVVPAVDFPCGVAWNPAGPDGMVFPPLRGFVPDEAALDDEGMQ